MSVLRTVRKRKKVRKLGSVKIIRREAYAIWSWTPRWS